jgi:integrase
MRSHVGLLRRRARPSRLAIHPELVVELKRWQFYNLKRGLAGPGDWLLPTRTGKQMYAYQMEKTVKIAARNAGVRPHDNPALVGEENFANISPHTLRRTFGSTLLNQGVRIEVVSALLGHKNVAITQKAYAELLQATVAREVRRVF